MHTPANTSRRRPTAGSGRAVLAILTMIASSLLIPPLLGPSFLDPSVAASAAITGTRAAPMPLAARATQVAPASFATAAAPLSGVPTSSRQVIAVTSPSAGSSEATLRVWQRDTNGIWSTAFGPVRARVGSAGIGAAREGSALTPRGTHRLDQAFGRLADPGTRLPYFQTDSRDWWDGNVNSPTYNLHVRRTSSPGGASENLLAAGTSYDYAINMAYNASRVPGGGSAFFLHVSTGKATAGCVAIDRAVLRNILRWIDPAKNPVIDIRVGAGWQPPAKTRTTLTQTVPTQFVTAGRTATLKGMLVSATGQRLGGMSAQIWARAHGGKNWAQLGIARTNSAGAYAFTFRPTGRKDYLVRWPGAVPWHGSSSRVIYLPVK